MKRRKILILAVSIFFAALFLFGALAILAAEKGLSESDVAVSVDPGVKMNVLVFSRTTSFRHDSIPAGIVCLKTMAEKNGRLIVEDRDHPSIPATMPKEWTPAVQETRPEPATLAIGTKAPDFKLMGVDDKAYGLKDFASNKCFVVVFSCDHCPTTQAYEHPLVGRYY
jgi:hypothetical protein